MIIINKANAAKAANSKDTMPALLIIFKGNNFTKSLETKSDIDKKNAI
jgi:hypothetical protein